jgi:putative spermidine/putrescine transport system permease protein
VTDIAAIQDERGAPPARPVRRIRSFPLSWSGLVPFFVFAGLFLGFPLAFLAVGSFADNATGAPTLANYTAAVSTQLVVNAFKNSIEISLVTAIVGGIFGFLLALSVILGRLPRFLRSALTTFSGVASNFAGIPLALAFAYTLSQIGLLTVVLKNIGIDIYAGDFKLFSKFGIEIVYLYFQFPLMVLIIAPAIDGLKPEWREAAENMGATGFQYWRRVGLPILTPTLLGSMILLFGNSFGAQATAYQLTAGQVPLVPLAIGNQISGDVLHNVGLGYAMAMGMVAVMGVSIVAYSLLQRQSERWLRT